MPVVTARLPVLPRIAHLDASVIVCTYSLERWEILNRAVDALRAQTLAPVEVIIVVDNNDDLHARAAAKLQGARVVANRHPGGASGARLTGSECATAPILVFLDDDAIADPDWLENLVRPFEDPLVIGVGGQLDPLWERDAPRWLPAEFFWVIGCSFPGMSADGARMRNPIAANMAVRSDVYARTGGMAPELGRSDNGERVSGTAEETELSIRASRRFPGTYWAYAPSARVQHFVPASRTTFRYFVRRCRIEGAAKAVLIGMTGTRAGLASERAYVRRILPRALAANIGCGITGEPSGLARAAAIIAGLLVTTTTYAGHLARRASRAGVASSSSSTGRSSGPTESSPQAQSTDVN